ncbi:phage tail protein [Streptomyces sp. CB02959]|uniref:phage tail protein n=1 Tax=Streptomyces sp. CB02959 TaxID=2020330 RepID=UPI000C278A2A|nr:phage tail protein [Streptomyces sp. CB02959]PJN30967.1 phage tail protein [Streptomyces sp. CB02959]
MATTEYVNADYPIPTYRFVLDIDGDGKTDGAFSSVSGLEVGIETIEYKDGTGQVVQMPGQRQALGITLRRGTIPKDSPLFAWLYSVSENKVDKKDCTISLTDESGATKLVTWNITNAFPLKLSGQNLDGSSGAGSVEEVVLAADRLTVMFH